MRFPTTAPAPAALPGSGHPVSRGAGHLELKAQVPVQPGKLRLGLSVVIEAHDGALSYWALRHPQAKPDFHHAEAFALELE